MMPLPCHDSATHLTVCYFIYFGPWASLYLYRKFLCGHTDCKHKQASNKQADAAVTATATHSHHTSLTATHLMGPPFGSLALTMMA
jgi:hypothetical protein